MHSHSSEHTPGAVGSNCSVARGAVGGLVPCSHLRVSPQSWYWRWRECSLFTPPTDNSCWTRDSNPQPQFTSPTHYPIGHDCLRMVKCFNWKTRQKYWIGLAVSMWDDYQHTLCLSSSPKGVHSRSYLYCTAFPPQTLMEAFLAFYTYNLRLISSVDQPQAPSL